MFTGIIKDCGEIVSMERVNSLVYLKIRSSLPSKYFSVGNSIAVNGVCLTVESYEAGIFTMALTQETLDRSLFSKVQEGDEVNIEPAMTLETPLAGHLVSGHVDCMAKVLSAPPQLEVEIPEAYLKFCAEKGSITVNGVSLTIAQFKENKVLIALIPETLRVTNLGRLAPGDYVNIEVDMIARYLDQLNRFS